MSVASAAQTERTVTAMHGVVAAGHPFASAAGVSILRQGGNAVDAAVAPAAVNAVVLPYRTSIGGDLFALVYRADTGRVLAYNGSGAAPFGMDPDRFQHGLPGQGALIATVPGIVAAWDDMLRDHGRFGLERALQDAIRYAEDGFPVSARFIEGVRTETGRLRRDPECSRVLLGAHTAPRAGGIVLQADLAKSLRALAKGGAEEFYRGALAGLIARGIGELGGCVTQSDLAAHRTDRPHAVSIRYRDHDVFGQPPVSQGHVFLEELAIASELDLARLGWASADLVHQMVEIKKIAFADRDLRAGDPRTTGFDPRLLLGRASLARRRAAIGERARPSSASELGGADDTTYLAVVDDQGNAASLIESVFHSFGACAMVPGTGILLNDRLTGFSLDPGSPNRFTPGKRPVHTLNTAMVLRGGRPKYVFGTRGAHAQVQTNFQVATGLLDFGLGLPEAIEQPRWFHDSWLALRLEQRFPASTVDGLIARGHEVELLPEWSERTGGMQGIAVEPSGFLVGAADPRREGVALGY